jgi:hypothetical protein
MFTCLSVEQVETILMHELYHLRRIDFLVNIIQLVLEGLFFYNPAVWIISQMIRSERENCCDDNVLQSCGDPILYASALFHLAGYHQSLNKMIPGAGGSDQDQLYNRIKRILNQTTMKTNIREKLLSLLILAGGMVLLFTVSGFSSGFPIVKLNDSRQKMNTITYSPGPNQALICLQDTLPAKKVITPNEVDPDQLKKEIEAAKAEALKAADWNEIQKEMKATREEALADINWEEIEQEMKATREEALADINWDQLAAEMEKDRLEVMDSIDWEEIKEEMAKAKIHMDSVMQDFDFDFHMDFDMEEFKTELKDAMKEIEAIDWENIKKEIEESMEEIDWKEMKKEMEKVHIHLDSVLHELDHKNEQKGDVE